MRPPRSVTLADILSGVPFELNDASPQATALAAWWPGVDSARTTKLREKTGRLPPGVFKSATQPGWVGDPYVGHALHFNSDACVNVYSTALNAAFSGQEGTLLAWIYLTATEWADTSDWRRLFYFYNAGNCYIVGGHTNTASQLWFQYTGNTAAKAVYATPTAEQRATWLLYGLSWSQSRNEMKAYINGVQVGATQSGFGTWTGNLSSAASIIGDDSLVTDSPFGGCIHDFRIYNYPLPDAVHQQVYDPATRWELYRLLRRWWAVGVSGAAGIDVAALAGPTRRIIGGMG